MKGQIRKRGSSYAVIVPLPLDASGKKRYKWVTAHSKREAQNLGYSAIKVETV